MRPVFGEVQYDFDQLVWEAMREKMLEEDDVENCRVVGHIQPWLVVYLV